VGSDLAIGDDSSCPYQSFIIIHILNSMMASAPRIMSCSLSQPRHIVIHPGSPSRLRPMKPPNMANSRKNRPTVNVVSAPSLRAAFSHVTYRGGTTSSAGRSGAVRASPFNWNNRTATTDISPIIGSSRSLSLSCRFSTRRPVFRVLCHSSVYQP
jgi:hypothetical protein